MGFVLVYCFAEPHAMALSSQLSLLFLVAAAASLHFPCLMIDARATPESNFGAAVAGRGHALYGGDSGITADALYRIESQFDNDDKEEQKSHASFEAEPKTTNAASKAASTSTTENNNGDQTSWYRFGDDRLSGAYGTNEYGSRQREFNPYDFSNNNRQSSTKAQSYQFGNDVNYDTNEFGRKQQDLGAQSTSNPNTYGTYRGSSNFYGGGANADTKANPNTQRYYGMSDTRRPENQQLYYNAAKGLASSSKSFNGNDNGHVADFGFNNNKQSQNEYETMEEYYKRQGIHDQP